MDIGERVHECDKVLSLCVTEEEFEASTLITKENYKCIL